MRKARNTVATLENLGMLTLLLLLLCLIIVTVDNINKSITAYVNPTATAAQATAVINPTPTVDPEMGIAVYATCRDGTMKKVSENTCQYNDGVKLYHYQGPPGTLAVVCNNGRTIKNSIYPTACNKFGGFRNYLNYIPVKTPTIETTPTATATATLREDVLDLRKGKPLKAICHDGSEEQVSEDNCVNSNGVRIYHYEIPENVVGLICADGTHLPHVYPNACNNFGGFSEYKYKLIINTPTAMPTYAPSEFTGTWYICRDSTKHPNAEACNTRYGVRGSYKIIPGNSTATPLPTRKPVVNNSANTSGQRIGARCNNGTFHRVTGRGACTRRGGVAEWVYAP